MPHVYAQGSNGTVVNEIINLCNQYQTICGTQMCSSVAPSVGVDTASCMKALPAVRQFFNSNRTSPSLQLQPGATSSFKTYKNSTYGIMSVQYPSDWTINETNSRPNNSSVVDIVTFYPSPNSYPSSEHPSVVRISVDNPRNSQVVRSLSNYLEYTVNSYSQGHPDYTTINSNTTAKLGGLPAYSLEFNDRNPDNNSTYRELELGTIISGKVLYLDYYADAPSFSKFFQQLRR
jgi:hypothetical protein